MPFYQSGTIQLYYEEYGTGEPVVLLHGSTFDRRMWQPQIPALSRQYRLIAPDSRGHGLSDCPVTDYGRDFRVEDVRSLADILNLETFHLVGLSMGGSTAIGFARKYQERLKSLVLVSTGAAGYSFGNKFKRYFDMADKKGVEETRRQWLAMTLRWFGDERPDIRELITTMVNDHSFAVWTDPQAGKYASSPDLDYVHEIRTPTRILVGRKDKLFVPLAEELCARIPHSSLTIYEDAGHMLNLEEPERFNAELGAWLSEGYRS